MDTIVEMTSKQELFLKQQLKDISSVLKDQYQELSGIGVLDGISGIALFQFYYAKYLDDDAPANTAADILSESIERINEGYSYPTYCTGIAGVGWLVEHLAQEDFIDIDTDTLLLELDEYLYKIMINDIQKGDYDFLHGAIGYGYYFLKRFKNTKIETLKKKYTQYLLDLINNLKNQAEIDPNGYKWSTVLNRKERIEGYNLSLSHGISSIVNFLSRLYNHSEFKEVVDPLLRGSISYILSHEHADKNLISLFPSWITVPAENRPSRLAWCYGDLGIGLSLHIAAKVLQDDSLKNKSLEILKHAANRRTVDETLIKDTAICHGTYGNAQIFSRLYRDTKEEIFGEAASYWIEKGITMTTFSDGYAGHKQWNGEKGWENEIGLLAGIAGIGMTIIFYLSDFETNWDECLMIS